MIFETKGGTARDSGNGRRKSTFCRSGKKAEVRLVLAGRLKPEDVGPQILPGLAGRRTKVDHGPGQKSNPFFKTLIPRYQTLHLEYPVEMRPRYGFGRPPHGLLSTIISQNRDVYVQWLTTALQYSVNLKGIPRTASREKPMSSSPFWQNGFLPGLDITMLYTIVASVPPPPILKSVPAILLKSWLRQLRTISYRQGSFH